VDKFKDMKLPQLEAAFSETKAAFDAILAKTAPTVEDRTQAAELKAELIANKQAQAALGDMTSMSADLDTELAEIGKKPEPEVEAAADDAEKVEAAAKDEEKASRDEDGTADRDPVEGQEDTTGEKATVDKVGVGQVAPADGESDAPDLQAKAGGVATLAAKRRGAEGESNVTVLKRQGRVSLVAAADAGQFTAGQSMDSFLDVASASLSQAQSFPDWQPPSADVAAKVRAGELPPQLRKFPTAQIDLGIPDELMIDPDRMSDTQMGEIIDKATDESNLAGGSLTASAGWCAPSETVYDLTQSATTDGMLSHPEVGVRRGGLKWPLEPDFSVFYANPGFKYTEAEVIAGVTKPCITVPCPTFDEARLSVEGLCIKIDILTNVGYPEVVRNFVDGTQVAHQHWMNATKIAAMVTIAGTAKQVTGLGATTTDLLNSLEVLAERTRQKYKLRFNQTLEVVLPHWVLLAIRADLSNRTGVPLEAVTDAQISAYFRARNLNAQFVYDWQELPLADVGGTATVREDVDYPATVNVLMYPAGTFIFGTAPVISLSTVYDAASLAANQYTGLFTEQGWLVAKRRFNPTLVTVPICNAGRTGAADLACA
jgi:hypothetical protein